MAEEAEKKPDRWFRSVQTGDLGYMVERDGKTFIRLDRPNDNLEFPYRPGDWIEEVNRPPLSAHIVGEVCFNADKALCKGLGMHGLARRDWQSLSHAQRMLWRDKGPTENKVRAALWQAIKEAMREYTDG